VGCEHETTLVDWEVNECEIQRAVEEHRRLIHPVDALHLDGDLGVSEVECSDHAADRIADEETDR